MATQKSKAVKPLTKAEAKLLASLQKRSAKIPSSIVAKDFDEVLTKSLAGVSAVDTSVKPVTAVETTLAERGGRYGDFTDHAAIAQHLQDVMRNARTKHKRPDDIIWTEDGYIKGWDRLSFVQRQALTVFADKIARILSGDPDYADNWHDIQGYAKLVEDRLPK